MMSTVYDEVPYANLPFAQALPSGFATVATLHGLTPPDPRRARVLELGCGAGANLAGIAAADPEVRRGRRRPGGERDRGGARDAAAAGLDNVRFEVGDVLALTDGELGEFDYVIVHGLYAWAAEPVREAVLAACRSHLAADGIAYVSYNTHPGGHLRQMLREMAQWHARGLDDPRERAERARGLFTLLDRIERVRRPVVLRGCRGRGRARARHRAGVDARPRPAGRRPTSPCGSPTSRRRPARHGLAYVGDAIPGVEPAAAVDRGRRRVRRRRGGRGPRSRASSTSTCSCCGASATRCCAATSGAPTREVDRGGGAAAARGADGDDSRARAAARRARRRRRRCRSRAARAARHAGGGARRVAGRRRSTRAKVAFHAVPVPAPRASPASARVASALARSQARPGAIVTTLAQPASCASPTSRRRRCSAARRHARPRGDPRGVPRRADAASLEAALAKLAELGLLVAARATG